MSLSFVDSQTGDFVSPHVVTSNRRLATEHIQEPNRIQHTSPCLRVGNQLRTACNTRRSNGKASQAFHRCVASSSPAVSPASSACPARHRPAPTSASNPCAARSEEHTSELQSLMRILHAVFCLKQTNTNH